MQLELSRGVTVDKIKINDDLSWEMEVTAGFILPEEVKGTLNADFKKIMAFMRTAELKRAAGCWMI